VVLVSQNAPAAGTKGFGEAVEVRISDASARA
jgi:hypothetical protein